MTTRFLLGLLLIALLPLASAGPPVDVSFESAGERDCATSRYAWAENRAEARALVPEAASASATAGTYCDAWESGFTHDQYRSSSIDASAVVCTPSACERAEARWWSSSGPYAHYCHSEVRVGSETQRPGCPLGPPPYVPALLP